MRFQEEVNTVTCLLVFSFPRSDNDSNSNDDVEEEWKYKQTNIAVPLTTFCVSHGI